MGLDWLLEKYRPRRGQEKRYRAVEKKLLALQKRDDADPTVRDALMKQFEQVAHAAVDEVQAPRVGIDPRATRWFKKNVWAREQSPPPFEEAVQKAHGSPVFALARHRDGVAGGSFMVGALDFGAGIIDSCLDVVGDLASEAWANHSAREAAVYARKLERALRTARSPDDEWKKRLAAAARKRPPGPKIASSGMSRAVRWEQAGRGSMHFDDQRAAVEGIVRWLKFWSSRGYGFRAWG